MVKGMGEAIIAFEEPRKKEKTKVSKNEKTYTSMVETSQLNTTLTTYYQEFEAYSRGNDI